MQVGDLTEPERQSIQTQLASVGKAQSVEAALGEALTRLSGLTRAAAVVLTAKSNSRLKHIEFVRLEPERALVVLAAWASFVRDAVCFAAGTPELAVWTLYRTALERWAEGLPAGSIVQILSAIVAATDAISINAQPRLTFEALLLGIFAGPDGPPVVDELPVVEPAVSASAKAAAPARRRRAAPPG